jgi:mannose-6-phosphate isomerase-like protein (cupin superfamily)
MHAAALGFLILAQAAPAKPVVTFTVGAELVRSIEAATPDRSHPEVATVRLAPSSDYPLIGVRRTARGQSELHAKFADVWYVLRGGGTVVTGGTMADGVETDPGETRGSGIAGGETRQVKAGDVVLLPAGVPHWVSAVEGKELLYLVVKVPARE